ncbi:succinylglutamate desuccinylase / Aspartoacylase family protein, partial [Vibrio harveyi]
TFEFNSS